MDTTRTEYVISGSFLSRLDRDARDELTGLAMPMRFAKGDSIFSGDDGADSVYIVVRGRVKVFCLAEEGKELILWFFLAGDLFGVADTPSQRRGACARACEATDVLQVPRVAFRDFLTKRPTAGLTVIDTLSRRLRTLSDVVQSLATTCVTGRVVRLLQQLDATYGPHSPSRIPFDIPLTHQDIADMVGCCRQSVTETLGILKRSGAISCERQRVRIIDSFALEAAIPNTRDENAIRPSSR